MTDDRLVSVRRALLSVSDKAGLVELGRFLAGRGIEILSTGGTARALVAEGIAVTEVSAHTGFPEILDGRVKTLHPAIHGGILARRELAEHRAAMAEHKIAAIDLVIVNLYPFEATLASGAGFDDCVENIDIGGPALIRAAAKNHVHVAVATDPADYEAIMAEMAATGGATTMALRRNLAARAYSRTAAYDAVIGDWFARREGKEFPQRLVIAGKRAQMMRYGENPHQAAAFYLGGDWRPGVGSARQLHGKELSYNNLVDADAAIELVAEFERPAVAIVKHANPCGVATADALTEAYGLALACDPVSAFGGIVAVNRPLDAETARVIAKLFAEVVIAPGYMADALSALAGKKNLRLLDIGHMPSPGDSARTFRSLAGGFLVQTRDNRRVGRADLTCVTKRAPSAAEIDDLLFAFAVCKHVKSNAIVYARDGATVGIGAGQMSRIDSTRTAALKAEDAARLSGGGEPRTRRSVVASDAFFPFPDGLIAAAQAGVTAVIQPGGSVRDAEVIAAADDRGLAMVFTGVRHFRH